MDIKWKVLFGKTIIWLAAEIILCFVGMDDVADYSEFLFDRHPSHSDVAYFKIPSVN